MSNSLWPHGLQHSRLPCPPLSPGAYSNSCLLSQWCDPTISSSVTPFSSCPQSFPGSGSFPMSRLFTSGGQTIGASASTSVLPMNTQGWLHTHVCANIDICACKQCTRARMNTKVHCNTRMWEHMPTHSWTCTHTHTRRCFCVCICFYLNTDEVKWKC